ncbi:MAG: hypothetical protein WCD57_09765 [Acidobacteriaceae bacterium]
MLTIRTLALFVSTATVIANCPVPSKGPVLLSGQPSRSALDPSFD